MSPPEATPLEALLPAELRGLVGELVAEVDRLRAENRALRDEVARLKGLPPRPPPARASGMEQATGGGTGTGKGGRRSRRRRGAKRDRDAVTAEVVVEAVPPAGSRFKGYQDILVRELRLSAEVVRYRRERWLAPSGETVLAPLPAGIVGGFGPGLRRFLGSGHESAPPYRASPSSHRVEQLPCKRGKSRGGRADFASPTRLALIRCGDGPAP